MDTHQQIRLCIQVWQNRLKRYESEMKSKKHTLAQQQSTYEQAVAEAQKVEEQGVSKLQKLNEVLCRQAFDQQSLTGFIGREKSILQKMEQKKQDVKLSQKALESAQYAYVESKKEVSFALRKIEKYTLISDQLG